MIGSSLQIGDQVIVERQHLQQLLDVLRKRGYRLVGPTVQGGAIVYDELNSTADLPVGWMDEQDGGTYRLKKRNDEAFFGYVVGPHSWKRFLHPPVVRLWQAARDGNSFQILEAAQEAPQYAFIGVRPCELHAIAIQDQVFVKGNCVDPIYKARREKVFMMAVNCGQAGGTCFCVSMDTGPKATFGFDLALTEVLEADRHFFVIEVGTELGAEVLREVPHREAREGEKGVALRIVAEAAKQMGRSMDTTDIKNLLYGNYEHPRWNHVAARCLTCANCT
ncbi:MAG: sulfite reductase subunit A, partial [candidate division NC10 bacterium]|nr:sulfite reductase subunit A [candidate division NC10 bacterium]